jgi:hypothetical protein
VLQKHRQVHQKAEKHVCQECESEVVRSKEDPSRYMLSSVHEQLTEEYVAWPERIGVALGSFKYLGGELEFFDFAS